MGRVTHGYCRKDSEYSSEYTAWKSMLARCNNTNNKHYGAQGVKVCRRWQKSFLNFLNDLGLKPSPEHSLDRFPVIDGDYKPSNCRWATKSEQSYNRRKFTRPSNRIDMTGLRFNRLVVINFAKLNSSKSACWNCRCDCGNMTVVSRGALRSGNTGSCGCAQRDAVRELMTYRNPQQRV
jgi:hypothetical protein